MNATFPDLAIGDRSPNFVLPGLDGEFYSFHERVRGNRTLLFLSSTLDERTASVMQALSAARDAFQAEAVDVLAVMVVSQDVV